MVLRRNFLFGTAASIVGFRYPAAFAQTPNFRQLLSRATADPDILDAANAEREKHQVSPGGPLEAQPATRKRRSSRRISADAKDLLIAFEVSGQGLYEQRYAHPLWPGGRSGVTIGIGYDLGYVKADVFSGDWNGKLEPTTIAELQQLCELTSDTAGARVTQVKSITISWPRAMTQFEDYLPYVIAQTEDTFPNCNELHDDSFGALVSFVTTGVPAFRQRIQSGVKCGIFPVNADAQFWRNPAKNTRYEGNLARYKPAGAG